MQKGLMAKNTTYLTAALTVQKILAFIYFWFISSSLSPGNLGQYIFALSYTTLFSIFVDLGLSPVLTREAAKDKENANKILANVIAIKIPLAIIAALAAILFINITGKPPEVRLLVYLATIVMLLDSFTLSFWVIFRAFHKLIFESIATIIVQIIIFTFGYAALKTSGEVKHLIFALIIASASNFIFSFFLLKYRLKFTLKPKFEKNVLRGLIAVLPAFALAGIFNKIYNTTDSVLLGYLAGDEAVGFFAIPAKVVYAFQQVIPAAFAAVIFPVFSHYYAHSKQELSNIFQKAFSYLLIVSLPMGIGLALVTTDIVHTVWPNYAAVIPAFYIMALAIPFIFLAFPTGYLLNACDKQKINTWNRALITTFSVLLNIILISKYSYFGAAVTFLVTNIILLGIDLFWVKKILPQAIYALTKPVFKTAFSTVFMAFLVILIRPYVNFIFAIAIGGLSYFSCLYILKGFRLTEVKTLFSKT